MTYRTRQIFAGAVILVWLIAAPSLILYLLGYSVDVREFTIENTGSIAVSAVPKDAQVELLETGEQQDQPALFNQLDPGQYTVAVSHPGFTEWSAQLEVKAKRTTDVHTVVLFYNDPEASVSAATPQAAELDSVELTDLPLTVQASTAEANIDADHTIIQDVYTAILDNASRSLYIVSEDVADAHIVLVDDQVEAAVWSPSGDQLLYSTQFGLHVYNWESGSTFTTTRQSTPITSAIWHPLESHILYSSGSTIWAIEVHPAHTTPRTVELYTGTTPEGLWIQEDGEILYFNDASARDPEETTQYSLPLL